MHLYRSIAISININNLFIISKKKKTENNWVKKLRSVLYDYWLCKNMLTGFTFYIIFLFKRKNQQFIYMYYQCTMK